MNLKNVKATWFSNTKNDIFSGLTVSLALIPEAISFAIICGVDPMIGLYASFCIAITISFSGGRPAMISAATGAMALVMVTLVKDYGIEYMFIATILTGIIQFILGKFKFGNLINFVPYPVILGFVNALAILIFMAQLPHFIGESFPMYLMVIGTLAIIYILPKFTKIIPSPLIAIVVMTIIFIYSGIGIKTVGDMGNITKSLPVFHLPNVPLSFETLKIILPYSLTLSIVGIMESLLTATILDDMTESKSDKSKEVVGQGISNVIAGLFGGMAGCAMIGQSVINVKSGGKTRLSTLISGLFLIILIMFAGDFVMQIPMAALVGIMIMVSISTFEWKSIIELKKMSLSCSITMLATMLIVVITHNLAQGVIVGIAISAIMFAWKITSIKFKIHFIDYKGKSIKVYRISGQIFFASSTNLLDEFDYANDPDEVIIDFKNAHIWDHSAVTAISKIRSKYNNIDKKVSFVGLNRESNHVLSKNDILILDNM